jgi:hypothetical protein
MNKAIKEYEARIGVVYRDGDPILPPPKAFQEEALRSVAMLVAPIRTGGRWHPEFSIKGVTPPDLELHHSLHQDDLLTFVAMWGDEELVGEEYEFQLFRAAATSWAAAAIGGAKLVVFPILEVYEEQLWAMEKGIYGQKVGHCSSGLPTPDHVYLSMPLSRRL